MLFSFLSFCLYRKETGFQGRKPEWKIKRRPMKLRERQGKKQMVRFDGIYEQRAYLKPPYKVHHLIQLTIHLTRVSERKN